MAHSNLIAAVHTFHLYTHSLQSVPPTTHLCLSPVFVPLTIANHLIQ